MILSWYDLIFVLRFDYVLIWHQIGQKRHIHREKKQTNKQTNKAKRITRQDYEMKRDIHTMHMSDDYIQNSSVHDRLWRFDDKVLWCSRCSYCVYAAHHSKEDKCWWFQNSQLFSKLLIVFISNCKGQWPCLMSSVIKALRISLLGSCFIILALRVTERVVTKNTYIDEIIRNKDSHFKTLLKAVKQVWIDWMIRVRTWSFTL